ncbi:MAG: response regulator [Chlorobiaceae bacterium]
MMKSQLDEMSKENIHLTPEVMFRIIQELSLHQTELEHQLKELEESLSRYTELYYSAPLGYLTLTRDGRIIEANLTAKRMFGAEYRLLQGIQFKTFAAAEDYHAIDSLLDNVFIRRVPAHCEVILLPSVTDILEHSPPCHCFRIDAVMSDISYECRVILSDITERKHAKMDENRIISTFLSNVSHELRSPIHGIMGLSKLLKEPECTKDELSKYIDLIHQGSERLLHLVNDLIDISRIEAEQIKLQFTQTTINKLLRDLHAFFEVQTKKKGLYFDCTTELSDSESVIETDGLRVGQILTNIIHNALKFTNSGGIHIGYARKENMLELYCADSGCGIPEAMQEKIFDRFHQVDNRAIGDSEGAGLGLNIAKSLTSLLGGTIGVESEEGKGSRFFFTLPYNPPDTLHSPITEEQAKAAAGITVLLAEDDMVSALLMKAILNKENMTVISADNGLAAVELTANHPEINLVLMDINMPVINGYDATCRIKQLRPELPVIGQTAYCSLEEREKAEKAGCDGFITKPINKSELLELIKKLLNR